MGGIVIDIWEKSNFLGAFGSQKGAKNALKAPPPYGRVKTPFLAYFRYYVCVSNMYTNVTSLPVSRLVQVLVFYLVRKWIIDHLHSCILFSVYLTVLIDIVPQMKRRNRTDWDMGLKQCSNALHFKNSLNNKLAQNMCYQLNLRQFFTII